MPSVELCSFGVLGKVLRIWIASAMAELLGGLRIGVKACGCVGVGWDLHWEVTLASCCWHPKLGYKHRRQIWGTCIRVVPGPKRT